MKTMKIVAPAGSIDRLYAAIKGGAEEIFMGLKGFGARRNAINLTLEEYKEALDYAHKRGVQIFLTLNTIMMDNEIEVLYRNIKELYKHGLDAIIVQDLGLAKFIKDNFPNIALHGSTQMTVSNHIEANFLKSLGFSRVVLPRELKFEEIKKIRENTDIELEIFVSGALCVSYSGNCYLSSFIGGRSGNRGMCAQPCRKKYSCKEKELGYFLSPKDQMYQFEEIKKLKDIGIDSIKIEGRMKEPNYVYQMVKYYRNLINGNDIKENSSKLFNRGYGKGYFYGRNEEILNREYASHLGIKLGEVKGAKLKLNSDIRYGDGIIYLSKNYEKIGGKYINNIFIEGKGKVKEGLKNDVLILKDLPKGVKYIFKNFDKYINDETVNELKKAEKREKIELYFYGSIGKKAKLIGKYINKYGKLLETSIESETIIERAKNKGIDADIIKEKLLELGDTVFIGEIKNIDIEEGIFTPLSTLKKLKQQLVKHLEIDIINSYRRDEDSDIKVIKREENIGKKAIFSAIVTTEEQRLKLKELGIEKIYDRGFDVAREENLKEIDLNNKLASNYFQWLENKNDKVTLNWNLNITNRYAFKLLSQYKNIETIILSPEMSYKRIAGIGETEIKKAVLIYGKLKGMYTEIKLVERDILIENEQGDKFKVIVNNLGNSEIYFEKPLNVIKDREYLESIGISELVFNFTDENSELVEKIVLNKIKEYNDYNYDKGVF